MDSSLILNYFEAQATPERRLLPVAPDALANDIQDAGFYPRAAEKAVQNVYEHNQRPVEKQHALWVERITTQLLAACREWNALLKNASGLRRSRSGCRHEHGCLDVYSVDDPHIVNAADFRGIQAVAESFESQAVFKKYPFS